MSFSCLEAAVVEELLELFLAIKEDGLERDLHPVIPKLRQLRQQGIISLVGDLNVQSKCTNNFRAYANHNEEEGPTFASWPSLSSTMPQVDRYTLSFMMSKFMEKFVN